ncbi:BTAD domain-containing putative transcriptional regulator [Ramlibacter sp. AN1015]|uniref:AfsR/SARP family transcriptional regulator n=1 Tax=Ramlibacter sp. AN1015 TaxID=3133428 RepID=UPI0030BEAC8C
MADTVHRVYLCGRLCARIDGRRVEDALPARQGRLLFAYLAAQRARWVPREDLLTLLWPESSPAASDSALSALLAKLRRALAPATIEGRHELRLQLPTGSWIDLEAAREALHRAESAVARSDWAAAWGPARVSSHIAARGFLHGLDAPWVARMREELQELLVRAHECVAASALGLGGSEVATAERAARALVQLAPMRESGHRALMRALMCGDNRAEALLVYERLRQRMRAELGTAPSPATQQLHRELLQAARPH